LLPLPELASQPTLNKMDNQTDYHHLLKQMDRFYLRQREMNLSIFTTHLFPKVVPFSFLSCPTLIRFTAGPILSLSRVKQLIIVCLNRPDLSDNLENGNEKIT